MHREYNAKSLYIVFVNNYRKYNDYLIISVLTPEILPKKQNNNNKKSPPKKAPTKSHSPVNRKIFLLKLHGTQGLKGKQNNQKLVYAYQEHKRFFFFHTYTPIYADTSK